MNELALFAGAGGGILGGKLLGWTTRCAVERDAFGAQVLVQGQNDGTLEAFPIWSDVTSFDGKPWSGIIDVISGGFPCQDISIAGKGAGITGSKSGLWKQFLRIVCDIQPRFVFVENSPILTSRGLGVVLGDLAEAGYDTEWTGLSAEEVGANHIRDRIWILAHSNRFSNGKQLINESSWGNGSLEDNELAHSNGMRELQQEGRKQELWGRPSDSCKTVGDTFRKRLQIARQEQAGKDWQQIWGPAAAASWWSAEPDVGRMANGVADRVDRIRCLGNGQVPLCAAEAFIELIDRF